MTLVIAEMKCETPGNATWCCWELGNIFDRAVMEMIGHKVVELPTDRAQKLLEIMKDSIRLQIELRSIFHPGAK